MKYGPVTHIPYAKEPGDMDEIIDLVSAYGSASYADGYHSYRSDREEISVSREAFTALLEAISKLIAAPAPHPVAPLGAVLYRYWQPSIKRWGYTEDGTVPGVQPLYLATPTEAPAEPRTPFAYWVYIPAEQRGEFVHDLDDACDDLTNCECNVTPLYEAPAITVEAEPAMVASCCGRSECGGECGREYFGMVPAHPKPAAQVDESANLHSAVVDKTPEMHVPRPAVQSADYSEQYAGMDGVDYSKARETAGQAEGKRDLIALIARARSAIDPAAHPSLCYDLDEAWLNVGTPPPATQVGSEPAGCRRCGMLGRDLDAKGAPRCTYCGVVDPDPLLATTQAPPVGVSDETFDNCFRKVGLLAFAYGTPQNLAMLRGLCWEVLALRGSEVKS